MKKGKEKEIRKGKNEHRGCRAGLNHARLGVVALEMDRVKFHLFYLASHAELNNTPVIPRELDECILHEGVP